MRELLKKAAGSTRRQSVLRSSTSEREHRNGYGRLIAFAIAACGLTAAAGFLPRGTAGLPGAAAADPPVAVARNLNVGGASVGEVDLHGKPILRIRASSGGFTAYERAQQVASRLNMMADKGELGNFSVGTANGEVVVLSNGREVITATGESARENGATPYDLARTWASNMTGALTGSLNAAGNYTYSGSRPYTQSPSPATEETHNADKLAPIISVGTGARLGVALVTGPSSRVAETVAVGQLEGKWKNIVEARVLVPVSNPAVDKGLHRVPEVSVYAVGDYRLP